MITVLNEMEYVVAILENDESAALPYTDDRIHEKLNDAYLTLTFRTHGRQADGSAHPDAAQLVGGNKVVYPDKDGELQLFVIKTVEEVEELDGTYFKEVYCEHTALELNGVVIRPQTFTGVTARQYLEHIISGTRWKIGVVEWLGVQTINLDDYTAGIQAIITGAEAFEGEFRFRAVMTGGKLSGLYVDLVERRGIETGIQIEAEHNMKSVKRIEDGSQIYTALIGLARGQSGDDGYKTFSSISAPDKPAGQDWIGASDALQKYGILLANGERQHYFGVYLYEGNENVTANRLLELTRTKLREVSVPKYTYETTFQDLSQITGYEATKFGIGDTLNIINVDFSPPLLVSARIIEAEYGSNPEDSNVILGDYRNIWNESQVAALRALRGTVMKSAAEWEAGIALEEAENVARAASARIGAETAETRAASYTQQTARVTASANLKDQTIKDRVTAAKTAYDTSQAAYVDQVNTTAADGTVTADEQTVISSAFNDMATAENELSAALQSAEENILFNTEQAGAAAGEAAAQTVVTEYAEKKIYRGSAAPTDPAPAANDLWVDTTDPEKPIWKQFDGTNWKNLTRTNLSEMLGQVQNAQLADNAVTASKILAGEIIASHIATGQITTSHISTAGIDAGVLTANSVIASNITFTGVLNGATGSFSGAVTSSESGAVGTGSYFRRGTLDDGYINVFYEEYASDGSPLYNTFNTLDENSLSYSLDNRSGSFVNNTILMNDNENILIEAALTGTSVTYRNVRIRNLVALGNAPSVPGIASTAQIRTTAGGLDVTGNSTLRNNLSVNGAFAVGNKATLNGGLDIQGDSPTRIAGLEGGKTGIGTYIAGAVSVVVAGVYQQFKVMKSVAPSSVTLSNPATPTHTLTQGTSAVAKVADITQHGFWLYFDNQTSGGFRYWRGDYVA